MKKLPVMLIACAAVAAPLPVVLAGSASAAAAAAAPPCGLGSPIKGMDGETVYLTAITARKGVSCAGARKAAKGVTDKKLCKSRSTHNGWTVRHVGSKYAIAGRFTRGKQSFDIASQGSC